MAGLGEDLAAAERPNERRPVRVPRPDRHLHSPAVVGDEMVVDVLANARDPVRRDRLRTDGDTCQRWRLVIAGIGGFAGRWASSGGVSVPGCHLQESVGGQTVGQRRGELPDEAISRADVGGLQDDPLHLGAVAGAGREQNSRDEGAERVG